MTIDSRQRTIIVTGAGPGLAGAHTVAVEIQALAADAAAARSDTIVDIGDRCDVRDAFEQSPAYRNRVDRFLVKAAA